MYFLSRNNKSKENRYGENFINLFLHKIDRKQLTVNPRVKELKTDEAQNFLQFQCQPSNLIQHLFNT